MDVGLVPFVGDVGDLEGLKGWDEDLLLLGVVREVPYVSPIAGFHLKDSAGAVGQADVFQQGGGGELAEADDLPEAGDKADRDAPVHVQAAGLAPDAPQVLQGLGQQEMQHLEAEGAQVFPPRAWPC